MYSRNQNRIYDEEDYDDEEMTEEYQLYAYNLPPNYDGSRFRRRDRKQSAVGNPPHSRQIASECRSATQTSVPDEKQNEKTTGFEYLSDILSRKIGYEELLIIALIIILAAESDRSDTLLILTLLLIVD